MKFKNILTGLALSLIVAAGPVASNLVAAEKEAAKPYTLDKCAVTDEKFEGSGMKPYQFVHEGQTIKLCCKSCLKKFNKDSAKYLKKVQTAQKAQEKKS